ncbi:MAG: hypothetical protein N2554_07800 [Fimbriimonadales bacterium]|nr:hypothetical protein [Fimbriimonadales bacterium]
MESIRENRQGWTPLERRLAERLRRTPIGACLGFDQLIELARRGQRAIHYRALMLHIISCPDCRRSYLQVRAIVQAQRPRLLRWLDRLLLRWRR